MGESGKVTEGKGRVKEALGALTGDEETKQEGRRDQAGGKVKQAGEKIKDAVTDLRDAAKR